MNVIGVIEEATGTPARRTPCFPESTTRLSTTGTDELSLDAARKVIPARVRSIRIGDITANPAGPPRGATFGRFVHRGHERVGAAGYRARYV